jgi:hypothetical protein
MIEGMEIRMSAARKELEEQATFELMEVCEVRWDKGCSDLAEDCTFFCGNGNDSCVIELSRTVHTVSIIVLQLVH